MGSKLRRLRALVASLALAGLAAGAAAPHASADNAEVGQLRFGLSKTQPDTLLLYWSGKIAAPMAQQVKDAFEQRRSQTNRVVFTLSTGGGSVFEGERVIEVLRDIKRTHRLETVVNHGNTCGSMCVFVFLQGHKRVAALSSTWLFHEVSKKDGNGNGIILDRGRWERLVNTYYPPAGVSADWTARMKPYTLRSDYWQTGADLVNDNSGIIHEALGNQRPRIVADGGAPAPTPPPARIATPSPQRQAPATEPPARRPTEARGSPAASEGECRIYLGSVGAVVRVPCPAVSARD